MLIRILVYFVSIDGFLCKVILIILKCTSGFITFGWFLIFNSKSLNNKYVLFVVQIKSFAMNQPTGNVEYTTHAKIEATRT